MRLLASAATASHTTFRVFGSTRSCALNRLEANFHGIILDFANELASWFLNLLTAIFIENHLQQAVLVVHHKGHRCLCDGLKAAEIRSRQLKVAVWFDCQRAWRNYDSIAPLR
jgi:hypothetical protein